MTNSGSNMTQEELKSRCRSRLGPSDDRRRQWRFESCRYVVLITVANRIHGEIVDISKDGARVALGDEKLLPGRDVLLRWGSYEAFGQVIWCKDKEVGVSFDTAISRPLIVDAVGFDVPEEIWSGKRRL